MKRYLIELIFLASLLLITIILFYTGYMDKLSYYDMDDNSLYSTLSYLIAICLLLFNHFVLKYTLALNLLLSILFIIGAVFISKYVFWMFMHYLEKQDNLTSPIGWQFKYKWLQLLIEGVAMTVLTEIVFLFTRNIKTLYRS